MECEMTSTSLDDLICDSEACKIISCSKSSFWRRVADGTFPRPVKIGGLSRWLKSDIVNAIKQASERRKEDSGKSKSTKIDWVGN
jgi:predicted DNA-binding transcriptional regulator AlpA